MVMIFLHRENGRKKGCLLRLVSRFPNDTASPIHAVQLVTYSPHVWAESLAMGHQHSVWEVWSTDHVFEVPETCTTGENLSHPFGCAREKQERVAQGVG